MNKEVKTQGETSTGGSNTLFKVLVIMFFISVIVLCSIPFALNLHSSLEMNTQCDEILADGGFDTFNGRPALFRGDKYVPMGEKFVAHCEQYWAKH